MPEYIHLEKKYFKLSIIEGIKRRKQSKTQQNIEKWTTSFSHRYQFVTIIAVWGPFECIFI